MILSALTAISPVDGRYRGKTEALASYFSEFALIRYRVRVEAEYFCALTEVLPQLEAANRPEIHEALRHVYLDFSMADAERIKERMNAAGLGAYREFVHFGLTSQDINNTALPLSVKEALEEVYYPALDSVMSVLYRYAEAWEEIAMPAKTHGQPASPTRLGKEIRVFAYRLEQQLALLRAVPISAKFGGATGNFNAHHAAYPQTDWRSFADRFVSERLGLVREAWTTQISNYDNLAALFDGLRRVNTILIDLCRDMWQYISMDYFKQKIKAGEVGSSAMPHKVNPIDFENAEGNLGVADAILTHLSTKLPISRLQRDLTDSTVTRNIGVPLAHIAVALASLNKGLEKLVLNRPAIDHELDAHREVVAEAIQTILRREGYPQPYEALKALTRKNEAVTEESIDRFIDSLELSDAVKAELKAVNPHNYTGV